MMKKFILLAYVFAFMAVAIQGAAVPQELQEVGNVAHEVCVKETGATEDAIEKSGNGDFSGLEANDKTKCYIKCIFEQFQLIDKDDINYDVMLAIVPEEIHEVGTRVIENCRNPTGKDICEKAFNMSKCMQKESPEHYFMI